MQLNAGARLGGYEVIGALGAGGMGEVYRARDTKLGREVALKILPAGFASDPDRIARFHREAHVLASLNHPHIAAIHGLEQQDGVQLLVLELVDGETLAQRLKRGALPLDEAIGIARQIADALAAAHDKGIIHRDLKPANIALSSQDQVKVLDFGLARAMDAADRSDTSNSPTLTFHATQAGLILGTAAYMSPEQAKGRAADKRADIFSFGCVLYEMLAGRRAFEGEDVSDTLAAVLRGDPVWTALPATTPPAIRSLIQQCLAKDRKERIGDIAVAQYVLRNPLTVPTTAPAAAAASSRLRWFAAAIVATALIAGGAGWLSHRPAAVAPGPLVRFTIPLGADQVISEVVRRRHLVAVSPDGTRLAYIANDQIYSRSIDGLETAPIRGSREQPVEVQFSPDGQWLAYVAGTRLKKIPVTGGASVTIADVPAPFGMSWTGDRILFGAGARGILEIPADGGTPKVVIAGGPDSILYGPQLLPDGKHLLFTVLSGGSIDLSSSGDIAVQAIGASDRKILVRGGTDGRYSATGHLLFARDGVLFAQAMDVDRLELKGGPVGMVDGVNMSFGQSGAAHVAVSAVGTMVYLPAAPGTLTALAWRNRQGSETSIATPPHSFDMPRVSPDGKRIAVHALDQDNDIWIWDTVAETLTRLTFDRGVDSFPAWSPDGKYIVFASTRSGETNLYRQASDGTGQAEPLLKKRLESNGALVTNCVTPDGKFLVFSVGVPSNVMILPMDGSGEPRPLLNNPQYAERSAQISPDGRWMAYQSDESGSFQVYVRPFPKVDEGRWQISSQGGTVPIWSPNGRELVYTDEANHVMSVPVQAGTTFSFGKASVFFDFSDRPASVYRNYDFAPDGVRLAIVKDPQRVRGSSQFVVTLNWFDELRRRVPVH